MLVTLQLDQCTLPETGKVELNIQRLFEIDISADEARRIVKRWFFDDVTMSLNVEMPMLVIRDKIVWRVPAIYTASHVGRVGEVGHIDVDVRTGEMDISPEKKDALMQKALELAKTLPPYRPRKMDTKYVAKNIQPTVTKPFGNPFDIIDN